MERPIYHWAPYMKRASLVVYTIGRKKRDILLLKKVYDLSPYWQWTKARQKEAMSVSKSTGLFVTKSLERLSSPRVGQLGLLSFKKRPETRLISSHLRVSRGRMCMDGGSMRVGRGCNVQKPLFRPISRHTNFRVTDLPSFGRTDGHTHLWSRFASD